MRKIPPNHTYEEGSARLQSTYMTPWASGGQDQPERSFASTDKLIAKNTTSRRLMSFSSAVADGQPKAPLKNNSRERKIATVACGQPEGAAKKTASLGEERPFE